MNKFLSFIYSTRLMAVLFLVFAIAMGTGTFIENDFGTETAKALIYNAWWFEAIMMLFALNFFGNLLKFKLYKKEKLVVLVFHLAFFLILVGAGITRYISFEGIMPIKEGAVSNTFYSEATYISVIVNDGVDQKTPSHHKILLSAIGSNNYTYKTDFKETDVLVKLTDYIPNAQDIFEANENGSEYLKFVESGSEGRHDHFIKKGDSEVPVTHPVGLLNYAGDNPILPFMVNKYGSLEDLKKKYKNHSDPKTNKLSHIIWQRYASSVWDDIRIDNVLQYKNTKDEDDEKHVHPLQLDVIDRIIELYSNPGEVVLTPFMGVGSEVFSPVSMGRKAIGIELKDSYFKQAIQNLKDVDGRFEKELTLGLFDEKEDESL